MLVAAVPPYLQLPSNAPGLVVLQRPLDRTAAFFRISRSLRSCRFSRRRRRNSSRSSVVSASAGPSPRSTEACLSQPRTADSVRSKSRATWPTERSPCSQSSTTSALNSLVKLRRFLFAMEHLVAHSGLVGVSAKPDQDQTSVRVGRVLSGVRRHIGSGVDGLNVVVSAARDREREHEEEKGETHSRGAYRALDETAGEVSTGARPDSSRRRLVSRAARRRRVSPAARRRRGGARRPPHGARRGADAPNPWPGSRGARGNTRASAPSRR